MTRLLHSSPPLGPPSSSWFRHNHWFFSPSDSKFSHCFWGVLTGVYWWPLSKTWECPVFPSTQMNKHWLFPIQWHKHRNVITNSRPQHIEELPLTCTALLSYTVTPSLLGWALRSRSRRKSFSCPNSPGKFMSLLSLPLPWAQPQSKPVLMSQGAESTTQISGWKRSLIEGERREKRKRETAKWEFNITKPQDSMSSFSQPFPPQ